MRKPAWYRLLKVAAVEVLAIILVKPDSVLCWILTVVLAAVFAAVID